MPRINSLFLIVVIFSLFLAVGPFLSNPAAVGGFIFFLLAAAFLSWNLLPASARAVLNGKRNRFRTVIFICLLAFSFGGLALNFYLLPGIEHPLSLVANLILVFFCLFLFRNLIRPIRIGLMAAGFTLFGIFIVVLTSFHPTRPTGRQSGTERKLLALPYLATAKSSDQPSADGVTVYERSRSESGYNLYAPWIRPEAYLIDMSGENVHRWTIDLEDGDIVFYVEPAENGALLAITRSGKLLRLDRNSNLIWERDLGAHHDLARTLEGDLLVLTQGNEIVFYHGRPLPILNNHIAVVSESGELKGDFSFFDILWDELPPETTGMVFNWWKSMYDSPRAALRTVGNTLLKLIGGYRFTYFDLFHANTLEIADRDIRGLVRKGDLLTCSRTLDLVAVIDRQEMKSKWSWGPGILDKPHTPSLLKNGNLMIFDNGAARSYSRIIELDTGSKEIVWEYIANPPEAFYTKWRGSCRQLPGGNVLITESDRGRVFEITPGGETVWEFFCPFRDEEKNERSAIYRMERILDRDVLTFLGGEHQRHPPVE